jgi:DNA-binding beta-propeller fold protein YncE
MADHQLYMLLAGYGFIDRFSLPDITVLDRFAGADRYQVKSSQPALTGRPQYLVLSPDHRWIYIAENNRLSRVRRSHPKTIEVIAGSVVDDYPTDELKNKIGSRARFSDIPSFALSPDGTTAYVVDRNDNRIRRVDIKTGTVSYITGAGRVKDGATPNGLQDGEACPNTFEAGVANCAYFHGPMGSALSSTGRYLYVTDSGNNAIRRVTVTGPHTGRVITLAGTTTAGYVNAVGKKARFHAPIGLTINKAGTLLYIADRNNFVIRKLNIKTRAVTTLAGAGRNGYREGSFHDAVFSYPDTVTRHGRSLYVAEVGSHMIRKLDLETKMTSLVAGSTRGFANGSATQARFHNPRSPLIWKNTMWIADTFNDQIRKIRLK